MKIYKGLPQLKDRGRVVTLGVFDGVHRGHGKILRACQQQARCLQVPAAVITFDAHPHGVLAPSLRPPRLATSEQCVNRMQELGMDEVFLVPFTRSLARIEAEKFVREFLVQRLRVKQMVVGQDFVFGKNGLGTTACLRRLGKELGFKVTVLAPLRDHGRIISSSALRELVAQGQVELAGRWLGWAYALHGQVVRGDGRGTRIGLPTANLRTRHEVIPAPGIYAVAARLEAAAWPALCYIGKRPTFHAWGPETIEVHIPGWEGNLYHQPLVVSFLGRLREDRRFLDTAALLRQVKKDHAQAKKIWAHYGLRANALAAQRGSEA